MGSEGGSGGSQLTVTGVYSWTRHPMYTGGMVFLWSQPTMVSPFFESGCFFTIQFITYYMDNYTLRMTFLFIAQWLSLLQCLEIYGQ